MAQQRSLRRLVEDDPGHAPYTFSPLRGLHGKLWKGTSTHTHSITLSLPLSFFSPPFSQWCRQCGNEMRVYNGSAQGEPPVAVTAAASSRQTEPRVNYSRGRLGGGGLVLDTSVIRSTSSILFTLITRLASSSSSSSSIQPERARGGFLNGKLAFRWARAAEFRVTWQDVGGASERGLNPSSCGGNIVTSLSCLNHNKH